MGTNMSETKSWMLFVLQVEIEILIKDILILPSKIILEKKEMGDMSSHTAATQLYG